MTNYSIAAREDDNRERLLTLSICEDTHARLKLAGYAIMHAPDEASGQSVAKLAMVFRTFDRGNGIPMAPDWRSRTIAGGKRLA